LAGVFPRHEERSLDVLDSKPCKSLIIEHFGTDTHRATVSVLEAVLAHESPAETARSRAARVSTLPKHYQVLRAVLSSPIDVDKLDYVYRDAYHSGVPYGRIVDVERLLLSLRVWWGPGASPHLLLSDKGRVCAEALIFARYLMTSEVYWNHAVRAYAAMLSAAIATLGARKVKGHLWDTDDEFLAWVGSNKATAWLAELVQRRRPYRRAFVHQRLGGRSSQEDQALFGLLEKIAEEGGEERSRLQNVVARALSIAKHEPHEIVLDVPKGVTKISAVEVLPEGHSEPGQAGPIFGAIGENFDGFARKARIFVHPDLMPAMPIADSTNRVRDELISEYGLNA
jgi:HD superfamily phosphohydrolase